jgi:hypothetical protein
MEGQGGVLARQVVQPALGHPRRHLQGGRRGGEGVASAGEYTTRRNKRQKRGETQNKQRNREIEDDETDTNRCKQW